MLRQYVNNLQKELMIGTTSIGYKKPVRFLNGFYETDDPKIQGLIERNGAFGASIHFKDTEEEMARLGREKSEKATAEKARLRQEMIDQMKAEDKAAKEQADKDTASAKKKADKEAEQAKIDEADRRAAEALLGRGFGKKGKE